MASSPGGGYVWPPRRAGRRGTRLGGRYVLDGTEIGHGGSAIVLKAEDREGSGGIVAVKRFSNEVELDVLQREATLPRRIPEADDWLVCATDWGEDDGHAWIVMPYMRGGSLRNLIKSEAKPGNRLWVVRATFALVDVAAGLDIVHEADLVHRDVKPANVLFDGDRRAKLADFGIARAIYEAGLTPHGLILGSPPYLPPELLEGSKYTKAGDRYAFTVTLYETLVGRHPYPGIGPDDPIPKVTDWTPPSQANPVLPEEVDEVLLMAADPDPAGRWDSAGDMMRALVRHLPLSDADREEMRGRLAAGRRAANRVRSAARSVERNERETDRMPRERSFPAEDDAIEDERDDFVDEPLGERVADLERRVDEERAARAEIERSLDDDRALRVAKEDQLRAEVRQAKSAARRATFEAASRARATRPSEAAQQHDPPERAGAARGAFAAVATLLMGSAWSAWMWLSAAASFNPPRLPMQGDAAREYFRSLKLAAFERPPSHLWAQIAHSAPAHRYVLAGLGAAGVFAALLAGIGIGARRGRCLGWALGLGTVAMVVDLACLFGAGGV